jgi:hypothetical protein
MERRRYIRHPLSYPFRLKILAGGDRTEEEHNGSCENVSDGGLQFMSDRPLQEGAEVELDLDVENRSFSLDGEVVRCDKADSRYAVAVKFHSHSEMLKARMMEQVVRIEMLKKRMERRYNRSFDFAAIAREWIKRYSKSFAQEYGS